MTSEQQEIDERLRCSHARLTTAPYLFSQIFQAPDYPWPGDWEGRALLAFVSLRKTGVCPPVPCMDAMVAALPAHVNSAGYFGAPFAGEIADELFLIFPFSIFINLALFSNFLLIVTKSVVVIIT